MRQAAHILRKDLRFLWPQIFVVLALTAAFCWSCSAEELAHGSSTAANYLSVFLVLAWGLLIRSAIHKEEPTGDRQFWVTRPYCWKSLAGAKLLLLLCSILIPFLLSDIVILQSNGVAAAGSVSTLLERQLVLTAMVLLPLAALRSMVGSMIQIGLPALAVLVAILIMGNRLPHPSWGRLAWFRWLAECAILLAAASAVFACQYARRGIALSCGILAGAGAISLAAWASSPLQAALLLQSLLSRAPDPSSIRLQLSEEYGSELKIPAFEHAFIIGIDGLPPGTEARADLARAKIAGPDFSWSSEWEDQTPSFLQRPPAPGRPGMSWFQESDWRIDAFINPQLARKTSGRPVDVTLSVAMTLYRTDATARIRPGESQFVARLGTCSIKPLTAPGETVNCSTSVASTLAVRLVGGWPGSLWRQTPEIFTLSPVATLSLDAPISRIAGRPFGEAPLWVQTARPIACIQRSLQIRQVKLGNR
jgi:hypothetical protein